MKGKNKKNMYKFKLFSSFLPVTFTAIVVLGANVAFTAIVVLGANVVVIISAKR